MNVDLESWQAIAGAAALVVVTVHGKWEARKTRKQADKAVELSRPTGNGFAKQVTDALARIESKVDNHIATHAEADVLNKPRRPKRELTEL